jgi:hypothetical protein
MAMKFRALGWNVQVWPTVRRRLGYSAMGYDGRGVSSWRVVLWRWNAAFWR